MNQVPTDKSIEFVKALHGSDTESMRRIVSDLPSVFQLLRAKNFWLVCDAARRSSPEAIRTLIELGGPLNEQDSNGFTGLGCAVTRDRYDAAKSLLECGADVDLGCPIFNVATQNITDRIAMAELLLDYGADINQPFLVKGRPPRTVLSEAVAQGRTELAAFLKSRGARLPEELKLTTPTGDGTRGRKGHSDSKKGILARFRRFFGGS